MQVTLNPSSAEEVRLIAAFMNDLADLQELETEKFQAKFFGKGIPELLKEQNAAPAPAVEEAPVKKSRSKKPTESVSVAAEQKTSEPTSTGADESGDAPTASPSEEAGNEPATTAETVVESGSSETAEPVTHDTLRKLYGDLVTAGKRDEVVKAVKSFGINAIKDIPADKLEEVHAAMLAVQ